MRLSPSLCCLLLAWGSSLVAQEVKLPAEMTAAVGSWIIVAPEVVSGGKAKFRIDPGLQEVRLDLLFPPEVAAQARGKVLTSTVPGRYRVECWNAKGDVPSDIAVCWVTVGTPVVPPPPPPIVPPPIVPPPIVPPDPIEAGPRQVLILRESANDSPAMGRLINSLQAGKGREYLKSKGHACFVLDVDARDANGQVPANVAAWKAAIGTALPAVAILNVKGEVLTKASIPEGMTADDVLAILKGQGG